MSAQQLLIRTLANVLFFLKRREFKATKFKFLIFTGTVGKTTLRDAVTYALRQLEIPVESNKLGYSNELGILLTQLVLISVAILLISHVGLLIHQITRFDPLIAPDITAEITGLQKIVPENASILTSVRLTPWVQGWTTAKVYAPGILKDQHPSWEWQSYWSGSINERVSFLSTFPKPVYIFIDHSQSDLFVPKSNCIQKITQMLYLDNCQSKSNEHY